MKLASSKTLVHNHSLVRIALSGLGGFLTVIAAMELGSWSGFSLLMAPFGASCVLAFAVPDSPLSVPRNIIGGHLISTMIGLVLLHTVGFHSWTAALGVALSIVLMQLTKTVHPPAGADSLVVLLGGFGWSFLWTPVLFGSVLIVAIAWAFHKVTGRKYPQRWW